MDIVASQQGTSMQDITQTDIEKVFCWYKLLTKNREDLSEFARFCLL